MRWAPGFRVATHTYVYVYPHVRRSAPSCAAAFARPVLLAAPSPRVLSFFEICPCHIPSLLRRPKPEARFCFAHWQDSAPARLAARCPGWGTPRAPWSAAGDSRHVGSLGRMRQRTVRGPPAAPAAPSVAAWRPAGGRHSGVPGGQPQPAAAAHACRSAHGCCAAADERSTVSNWPPRAAAWSGTRPVATRAMGQGPGPGAAPQPSPSPDAGWRAAAAGVPAHDACATLKLQVHASTDAANSRRACLVAAPKQLDHPSGCLRGQSH